MKTFVYIFNHDSDKNILQEYLSNIFVKYWKILTVYMQIPMYVFHYNSEKNLQSEYLFEINYLKVLAIYVHICVCFWPWFWEELLTGIFVHYRHKIFAANYTWKFKHSAQLTIYTLIALLSTIEVYIL